MMILYAVLSIIVLTAVAVFLIMTTRIKICALCAGVATTWMWLLAARWLGYAVDPVILGMLMGGSVIGAMYKIDKRREGGTFIVWKLCWVVFGFSLVYSVLSDQWLIAGLLALAEFFAFGWGMGWFAGKNGGHHSALLEKMKNCCS